MPRMMMKKTNPWIKIESPLTGNEFNGQLAYKNDQLELMWAKNFSGNPMFIIHTNSKIVLRERIPSLKGINVTVGSLGKHDQLLLTLQDKEESDIFHTLCIDLIHSIETIKDELIAIKTILKRLEAWQHFLKSNRKIIDKRQLKGLIGELIFLKNYLLENYKVEEALSFWKAPLQSVQDFEMNSTAVEVKTKSSVNSITISSQEQLYCELDHLLLYVVTLGESTKLTNESFNIYDIISQVHSKIRLENPLFLDTFDNLLLLYGFIGLEEYSEHYFLYIADEFYRVIEGFPRIGSLPNGVDKLTYRINLDTCKDFLLDSATLQKIGIIHG
jgi:hypothetical protein